MTQGDGATHDGSGAWAGGEPRLDAWFPSDLLARAERLCVPDETLAEFILVAVEQEVRRRQGMRTYTAMLQLRARASARPPGPLRP